jgi:hypothetical protein
MDRAVSLNGPIVNPRRPLLPRTLRMIEETRHRSARELVVARLAAPGIPAGLIAEQTRRARTLRNEDPLRPQTHPFAGQRTQAMRFTGPGVSETKMETQRN